MHWMELLDYSKWPGSSQKPRLQYKLCTAGDMLCLRESDIQSLKKLVHLTNLNLIDCHAVKVAFERNSINSKLSKNQFDVAVKNMIEHAKKLGDKPELQQKDKNFVSFYISKIFYALDRDDNDEVSSVELTTSFLLFVAGSKVEKMVFAYSMLAAVDDTSFNSDTTVTLHREPFHIMVRSFLSAVLALSEEWGNQHHSSEAWRILYRSALDCTNAIFTTEEHVSITGMEFLNECSLMSWVDLLDFNLIES
mmetsp:Transcript_11427/g.13851  ORF Transcript_11427/g.13851 Transcript_11427/m.13851 type:complete len:250 (+) Transcript_11427:137-886(+)